LDTNILAEKVFFHNQFRRTYVKNAVMLYSHVALILCVVIILCVSLFPHVYCFTMCVLLSYIY